MFIVQNKKTLLMLTGLIMQGVYADNIMADGVTSVNQIIVKKQALEIKIIQDIAQQMGDAYEERKEIAEKCVVYAIDLWDMLGVAEDEAYQFALDTALRANTVEEVETYYHMYRLLVLNVGVNKISRWSPNYGL